MSITTRPAISEQQATLASLTRSVAMRYGSALMLLAACGGGGDSGSPPNTPTTTPTALVVQPGRHDADDASDSMGRAHPSSVHCRSVRCRPMRSAA